MYICMYLDVFTFCSHETYITHKLHGPASTLKLYILFK